MSTIQALLSRIQASGIQLALSPEGKLRVSPPGGLSQEALAALRSHREEVRVLLTRPFLPRPAANPDAPLWDAWTPLFDWLIQNHPDHFHAVCAAEDEISRMERAGITDGPKYDEACRELSHRFAKARGLRMQAGVKVWVQ